ncbi:Tyrosine-protein phosphatase YwqE [Posidoniimonas polymericola]|uniref:protein-tyrosine-phosphatase n=1 Tax=Posidoniimonas polymericola TaxID=2528002 RepID=A0A5C5XW84_9BACT|nr:CpsB/CapC family capsule biosynthesis tyrosine phosphatase [Posidoniimonas polymericola]TWT66739.1 Tyrosine-protein phosphatase YwqE [Posidoniimonas polymericola]
MPPRFVDIHCHMLPGIDDGARDSADSLAMALLAVEEGIDTIVVTPHQLGGYVHNRGDEIRVRAVELQELLRAHGIPLRVLPGADVRIDDGMVEKLVSGEVLTVADKRRHVLLELPHELYQPLEPVLDALDSHNITGILTHPERNRGILSRPSLIEPLVERGCLMQVTAGSLAGGFGDAARALAERMCSRGLVHFIATDAHGARSRRPKIRDAYQRCVELAGVEAADAWCSSNPGLAVTGQAVPAGVTAVRPAKKTGWAFWKKAA